MEPRIIVLALATLFCVVQSQLCVTPGVVPQVIASTPLVSTSQAISTPVVATTIIDNSVSAALANALQLLIVSNIIETKLDDCSLSNLINLNTIEAPCYPRVEVLQPIAEYVSPIARCASPVEIISPFRPTIESYPYLSAEIVSPNFRFNSNCNPCGTEIINPCVSNLCLPDVVTTRNYNVAEFLSPNFNTYNGCGVEVISPNPSICGTEVVSIPSYNNGCFRGYNELVTPIPYNSCGEIVTPFNPCGATEVISPCGPYYGGIPEVITPIPNCNSGCFGNVAEFLTPFNTFGGISDIISPGCGVTEVMQPCSTFYSGFPEVISPIFKPGCAGLPELLPNNPFGPCRDFGTPCTNFPDVILPNQCNTGCSGCDFCGTAAFTPNFCSVKEIVNPVGSISPIAAEVLIPSAIPAQLTCNFGYSPSLGPCVNFNVESLPFGSGFCC